jgi:hypothetical protein
MVMTPELAVSPFFIAAVTLGAIGAVLIGAGIAALAQARPLRFALRILAGLFLLAAGLLAGTLALGIQGYRALTHEEVAAHILVRPVEPQRFEAIFVFADGRKAKFDLAGDEIYIDAHILKWTPYANLLGLHTAYELDRVAGRYHAIERERSAARTVYALGREKPVDLFSLRRRYLALAPLFDAEYGSAAYVPVTRPASLELRVSTTGLLIRESPPASKEPY